MAMSFSGTVEQSETNTLQTSATQLERAPSSAVQPQQQLNLASTTRQLDLDQQQQQSAQVAISNNIAVSVPCGEPLSHGERSMQETPMQVVAQSPVVDTTTSSAPAISSVADSSMEWQQDNASSTIAGEPTSTNLEPVSVVCNPLERQKSGLGNAISSSETSLPGAAAAAVASTTVHSPVSMQPPVSDDSAVNFTANGFNNVAVAAPTPTAPSQTIHRQLGQKSVSHTSLDVPNISPATSSSSIAGTYSFSPGSYDTSPKQGLDKHREKRLQRNRESARLSRRRRKQYLEVLEERVSTLSEEMDVGRRKHVAKALSCIMSLREQCLASAEKDLFAITASASSVDTAAFANLEGHVRLLNTGLNRTCDELRIAAEFRKEQLKSLVTPCHVRFILWMTVQNEPFFRGGRAASERLSAARIGERMLSNGTDRASPCNGMWPLLCREISLSYEQEERVRNYQRTLLKNKTSWLDRHTTRAASAAIESSSTAINGVSEMVRQRESSVLDVLTLPQRVRFLLWARRRSDMIKRVLQRNSPDGNNEGSGSFVFPESPQPSAQLHSAANLYILDKNLQAVGRSVPLVSSLVRKEVLKKFSRRPSFESLGSHLAGPPKEPTLSGKKKKANSSAEEAASTNQFGTKIGEHGSSNQVTPEAAQAAAAQVVAAALGSVGIALGPPHRMARAKVAPVVSAPPQTLLPPPPVLSAAPPVQAMSVASPQQVTSPNVMPATATHRRQSTAQQVKDMFVQDAPLPTLQHYMNAVPEENDPKVDEYLMELADGDWVIGGFDENK